MDYPIIFSRPWWSLKRDNGVSIISGHAELGHAEIIITPVIPVEIAEHIVKLHNDRIETRKEVATAIWRTPDV